MKEKDIIKLKSVIKKFTGEREDLDISEIKLLFCDCSKVGRPEGCTVLPYVRQGEAKAPIEKD